MSAINMLRAEREAAARRLQELDAAILDLEGPRSPQTVTWPRMVEEASTVTWLLAGQVPVGGLGFLVADPGVGKTTLLVQLCLSLTAGFPFLRMPVVGGPRRVLYLATEARSLLVAKATACARSLNVPDPGDRWLVTPARSRAWQIGAAEIARAVKVHKPDLCVVDTLRNAWVGDENDAEAVTSRVTAPLRALSAETGTTFLGVHHNRKFHEGDEDDDPSRARGSGILFADADFFWSLTAAKRTDLTHPERRLHCKKNRGGAPFRSRTLTFDFEGATLEETVP